MTRLRIATAAASLLLSACVDPIDPVVGARPEHASASRASHRFQLGLPLIGAAMNDRGTVVGWIAVGGQTRAAVWSGGAVTLLPGLGGENSIATAVNRRGDVAGSAEDAGGNMRAVLWTGGRIRDLGTLGGDISTASAINSAGVVVGSSEDAAGELHGFIWRDDRMFKIEPPARFARNTLTVVTGINDRREVVGWTSFGPGFGLERGFLWARGESIVLDQWEETDGPQGGRDWFETYPADINNRGQIVGSGFPSFQNSIRAVMWDRGEVMDVGALGSCPPTPTACQFASSARAISDAGLIVGNSETPGPLFCDGQRCPFLWKGGSMVQLIAPDGSPVRGSAVDIDNAGTVLGTDWLWGLSRGPLTAASGRSRSGIVGAVRGTAPAHPRPWAFSYCQAEGRDRSSPLERVAGC